MINQTKLLRERDRIAECYLVRHRVGNAWKIPVCPFCGREHSHGAGKSHEDPYLFLGWRVPHCVVDKGEYFLSSPDRPDIVPRKVEP